MLFYKPKLTKGESPVNLHVMAEKMAFFLVRKEIVKEEKADIYSFGLEIMFATLINSVLVFTASLIIGVFWQSVFMLVPFALIRGNAGGFHAKTHTGCILGFLSLYIISTLIVKWSHPDMARVAAFILLPAAAAFIVKIGVLPHRNRPVTDREYLHYKRTARALICLLSIVGLAGLYLASEWFIYYSLGIILAAGSVLVGCIQNIWERRRISCQE
jgi:accessory gene regulator B